MALASEIAVGRKSKWEVGPTNDVVRAFIETLVDPRLPYKCFINDPPSEKAQKSIPRQMHAVVLLYNYYHRKQKLELEFLDFVSFSKLALSLRPTLKPFMKAIHGSESVGLNVSEDHLSVTEKAIKSACDIAMSLDASRDVPTTDGYPISTVAVLLIDSMNENCLLQFDGVTEGVWSLIEKEIEELSDHESVCKKRKTNDQKTSADHTKFLQIGFDAVKDVTGIQVSDLVVLEAHVVYSLSKEKLAAQFYIMKCKQSFDISQSFALDSLVESLQGPFAEKYFDTWVTTELIVYHRLLPYAELITSWLPRKDSSVPILSDCVAEIIKNKDTSKAAPSSRPASSLAEYSIQDLDYINNNKTKRKSGSADKVAKGDGEVSQMKHKHLSSGKVASPDKIFHGTDKHGHASNVSETRRENVDEDCENHVKGSSLSGHSRGQSQRIVRDDDASQRKKNMRDLLKSPVSSRGKEKTNSNARSYHQSKIISSTQLDANVPENGVSSKDLLKSNDGRYRDERLMAGNVDTSNRNGVDLHIETPYDRELTAPVTWKVFTRGERVVVDY